MRARSSNAAQRLRKTKELSPGRMKRKDLEPWPKRRSNRAPPSAKGPDMSDDCPHIAQIRTVTPSARGCEECLKTGSPWLHLRLCRTCGHVGCCDQSPGRHATAHFHATRHPIIEGYDPPEGWGWCYVDEIFFELDEPTPQVGPIPRFY